MKEAVHSLGLMRHGDLLLGLPAAAVREVIPHPGRLEPLPMSGVAGAIRLRGAIIPVLDLATVVPVAAREDGGQVIVVMRHEGRVLGLQVDGVLGVTQTSDRGLQAFDAVEAGIPGRLATHAFETEHGVAALLDPDALAALPGVCLVREPAIVEDAGERQERVSILMFRCGSAPLGVESAHVIATVPRAALRDSPLRSALCLGVIEHLGWEIPVVDTLAVVGLGRCASPAESAVVILRAGERRLAFTLDEVQDIVQVRRAELAAVPTIGLRAANLMCGVVVGDGGARQLILDAPALLALPPLDALAGLSRDTTHAAQPGGPRTLADAPAVPYLIYDVDGCVASPLAQVDEVIEMPSCPVGLAEGDSAVLGMFVHRGEVLPLVDLAVVVHGQARVRDEAARVLIVRQGGRKVGLVVSGLSAIENARWEQRSGGARVGRSRMAPLVEFGDDAGRRTLPRLDLGEIVAALT